MARLALKLTVVTVTVTSLRLFSIADKYYYTVLYDSAFLCTANSSKLLRDCQLSFAVD